MTRTCAEASRIKLTIMQLAMEYREALNVEARQVVDIIDSLAARGVGSKTSWREFVKMMDAAGSGQSATRTAGLERRLNDIQQHQQRHSRGVTPELRLPTPVRADIFSIQSSPHGVERGLRDGRTRLTPYVDPLSMRTKANIGQHEEQQQQRPMTRGSGHVNPFEERREQLERASVSRQSLGSRRGSRGM
jgi:hypothetical protein